MIGYIRRMIAMRGQGTGHEEAGMRAVARRSSGVGRWLMMVVLIASLLVVARPVRADTTLTVNSTADPATGATANCDTLNTGTCTLRDAVAAANATSGATITFSRSTDPNFMLNSPLTLSAPMTIQGNGAPFTIVKASGTSNDVFDVTASGPVTLTGLAIAYGKNGINVTGTGGVMATADSLFGNAAAGIANRGTATVTMMSSALLGNTQGLVNAGSGTVNVIESTIASNAAGDGVYGGGVYNSGTANVTRSTLSQNSTTNRYGGGIYNSGMLAVTDSTLIGNTSSGSIGGGIADTVQGTMTVTGSTLSGNTAVEGGGIYCDGTAAASVKIANSTLAGNVASFFGGGVAIGCRLTVANSTLSANSAPSGGGIDYLGSNATPSVTNTLIVDSPSGGDVTGFTPDSTNLTGRFTFADSDPTMPQDHNGPTKTLALTAGSPAIGAGDPAACAAAPVGDVDQRGTPRLATVCDIGAYETTGKNLVVTIPATASAGGSAPLTVTAKDGFGDVMAGYRGTIHVTPSDPANAPFSYAFTDADAGSRTFALPLLTAGSQSVAVTDMVLTGSATFTVAPVVAAVGPSSGDVRGGGTVAISGAGFGYGAGVQVAFGSGAGSAATIVQVTNSTITVRVPAHAAGAVDVTVTMNGVSGMKAGAYIYGTADPIPAMKPPGTTGGPANPLPAPRPTGPTGPTGVTAPSPLPGARP